MVSCLISAVSCRRDFIAARGEMIQYQLFHNLTQKIHQFNDVQSVNTTVAFVYATVLPFILTAMSEQWILC